MWLAPQKISAPNLIEDIEQYLSKDISNKYNSLCPNLKEKIRVLTERLEFVDHLFVFSEFIERNSSKKKTLISTDQNKKIIKVDYEFILYKKT